MRAASVGGDEDMASDTVGTSKAKAPKHTLSSWCRSEKSPLGNASLSVPSSSSPLLVEASPYAESSDLLIYGDSEPTGNLHILQQVDSDETNTNFTYEHVFLVNRPSQPISLSWSPLSKSSKTEENKFCFVTAAADNCIRYYTYITDTKAFRSLEFQGHTSFVNSVACHPKENLFSSTSDDRSIRVWDIETNSATFVAWLTYPGITTCWNHISPSCVLVGQADGTIKSIDTRLGETVQKMNSGAPLRSLDSSRANVVNVGAAAGNRIVLWDTRIVGNPVATKHTTSQPSLFRWSLASSNIFATCANGNFFMWDADHIDIAPHSHTIETSPRFSGLSWLHGRHVCVTGASKNLVFWKTM
ncbi:Nucleoporin Nup37 [Pelomyxa schiedti]|nr:Nucleoporin Nup37 [Pelomyxa schiedti]